MESIKDLQDFVNLFHDSNNFFKSFNKVLFEFYQNVEQSFPYMDKCAVSLILQDYKFNTSDGMLEDENININDMMSALSEYNAKVIEPVKRNPSMTSTEKEAATIDVVTKVCSNKHGVFKELALLLQNNSTTETGKYMAMFLDNWNESELERFIFSLHHGFNVDTFFLNCKGGKKIRKFRDFFEKRRPKNGETSTPAIHTLKGEALNKDQLNELTQMMEKLNFGEYLSTSLSRGEIYGVELMTNEDNILPPIAFLKKLLRLDYRCRNNEQFESTAIEKNKRGFCNDDDDFFSDDVVNNSINSNSAISASDIVLTALFACDSFVLQDVFDKMSSCQLAIPVIVLHPKYKCIVFSMWGLRGVKKKWVERSSGRSRDANISSVPCNTVSFCRFGDVEISKSKIINTFMSTAQGFQEHSYFLNRDNNAKSLLNTGSIEACWYCPQGRKSEKMIDLTCIYNLRGDARQSKSRFNFLMDVSQVIVIFMGASPLTSEEQALIKKTKCNIILVQTDKSGELRHHNKMKKMYAKGKYCSDLAVEICDCIEFSSMNNNEKLSLEDHAQNARDVGIAVDEDHDSCMEGKRKAEEFIETVRKHKIENLKQKVVPLQGEYWKKWSESDKEESRHQYRGEEDPQTYSSNLKSTKKKVS